MLLINETIQQPIAKCKHLYVITIYYFVFLNFFTKNNGVLIYC